MNGIQFGVRLPVAGPLASVEAISKIAHLAEELNFDHVWVHDFIAWSRAQNLAHISCGSLEAVEAADADSAPVFFESITNLAFLAAATTSIRLGVSVLCLPVRHPVVAAKQLANVDVLSGGRLIVGVGVGGPRSAHSPDFEVLGVPRDDRYSRTKDYLKAVQAVWTQESPSHDGNYVRFPTTEIDPKPVQKPHPPIWIGGGRPRTLSIAAEFGDGWIPCWISPDRYPAIVDALRAEAREYGRDGSDIQIACTVHAAIARAGGEARKRARRTLAVFPNGYAGITHEIVEDVGLVGTPEEVAVKVERYVRSGVTAFELRFVYETIDHLADQLELFQTEVMSNFRS